MKKYIWVFGIVVLLLASCSSAPRVGRVDTAAQHDLSGLWNDTDVRIVCDALIADALRSPRVDQALRAMGGRTPRVIVGDFRNESSEHIDTGIIAITMEAAIFNSGRMDFVAGGDLREALRAERDDQQSHARESTAATLANESGADFMLTGTVRSIVDRADRRSVRTYFVNAEMTNIETNERVWMGTNSEIRKVIVQPRHRL